MIGRFILFTLASPDKERRLWGFYFIICWHLISLVSTFISCTLHVGIRKTHNVSIYVYVVLKEKMLVISMHQLINQQSFFFPNIKNNQRSRKANHDMLIYICMQASFLKQPYVTATAFHSTFVVLRTCKFGLPLVFMFWHKLRDEPTELNGREDW